MTTVINRFFAQMSALSVALALASSVAATHADTAERGIALRELGIPPATDLNGIIKLGCDHVLKITKAVSPTKSVRQHGNLFRAYVYRGMKLTTETDQATAVFGAYLPTSAFIAWGIPVRGSRGTIMYADVEAALGPTEARGTEKAEFYSADDERAILTVLLDGEKVTQFNWSCR